MSRFVLLLYEMVSIPHYFDHFQYTMELELFTSPRISLKEKGISVEAVIQKQYLARYPQQKEDIL